MPRRLAASTWCFLFGGVLVRVVLFSLSPSLSAARMRPAVWFLCSVVVLRPLLLFVALSFVVSCQGLWCGLFCGVRAAVLCRAGLLCIWRLGAMVYCVGGFDACCPVLLYAALFCSALWGALSAMLFGVVVLLVALRCVWCPVAPGRRCCVLLCSALLRPLLLCRGVVSCCLPLLCVMLFSSVLLRAVVCSSGLFLSVSGCPLLSSAGVFRCWCPCLAAWPAALLCAVVCRGALLPCAVSSGAVFPCGDVLWCPAVLFALLVVFACSVFFWKPLLYRER